MGQGCPRISTLDISGCKRITTAAIIAVAQGCPLLSSLSLDGCFWITDTAAIALAQGCPQLSKLSLWGCDQITDAGGAALLQGCSQLRAVPDDIAGDDCLRVLIERNPEMTEMDLSCLLYTSPSPRD